MKKSKSGRTTAEHAEIARTTYKFAIAWAKIASAAVASANAQAAFALARERAATRRDAIANERDRAAARRDGLANKRDRAATGREASAKSHAHASSVVARDGTSEANGDADLERAGLEARLQRAHLDALTGAYRREMGRLALRHEVDRARRADGRFVIAFVDVDGLKVVNDREGHAAGDRVLRMLGATMRANLRSYDPIVRFGGDEFVFGVASVDAEEVRHRIGVIDHTLRQATGVGITAGVADLTSNESVEELMARADAALIEAKRSRGS